jgi:SagB-type dehydrogenase family enzyme
MRFALLHGKPWYQPIPVMHAPWYRAGADTRTRQGEMGEGVGDTFQKGTKYRRNRMQGYVLDWDARPPSYKIYADAPLFELPVPITGLPGTEGAVAPVTIGGEPGPREAAAGGPTEHPNLWAAMSRRRSVRQFPDEPLTQAELSQLLWAGSGVTQVSPNHLYRAAPSAGGLYPIETYVVINRVEGIPPGLYHYRVAAPGEDGAVNPERGHALEQLRSVPLGEAIAEAALSQGFAQSAAAVFVWTAVFARSRWKYRERAFRYVYLDAGHIAAHVSLAAVALGLGSCQIAAFFDEEVDRIIGVDGENEAAVYMTVVGRRHSHRSSED